QIGDGRVIKTICGKWFYNNLFAADKLAGSGASELWPSRTAWTAQHPRSRRVAGRPRLPELEG
ncbi:MAG: hypothetical protein NTV22_18365, partial [bacterium]|nr:hypothetical protein [bacterium]